MNDKIPIKQERRYFKNLKEYKDDIRMGKQSEASTLIILRKVLNDETLSKDKDEYAVLDFVSKIWKVKCEVKGRRCSCNAYPTTMIGENKILEAERLSAKGWTVLFFFDFVDGLYYFNFNAWKTITSSSLYRRKMGGTYRRGLREFKMYCYIPVKFLTRVYFGNGSIGYNKTKRQGFYSIKQNRRIEINTKV